MMKTKSNAFRMLILSVAMAFLFMGSTGFAATWTIDDNYVGKYFLEDGDASYAQNGGDVISASSYVSDYDIDYLAVDINENGYITVSIRTDFVESNGINYGDLFISTTGWDPGGDAPYAEDTYRENTDNDPSYATNNTDWGYVFDTSTGNFYNTNDASFLMSDDRLLTTPSNHYRTDQLVEIDDTTLTQDNFISSAFTFTTGTDESGNNVLVYYGFNLSDLGLDLDTSFDLAFRWSMTCANDVIEGSVAWQPVPEPGTMMLFGMGLLGLGAVGRKTLAPKPKS